MDEKKAIEITVGGGVEGDLKVFGERVIVTIKGDVLGSVSIKQLDADGVRLFVRGVPYEEPELEQEPEQE